MGGLALMPGANIQFQFWFTPLVPILIQMVGLPYQITFPVYFLFFPIKGTGPLLSEPVEPSKSHIFLIVLCLWLLTVGPSEDLLQKIRMNKVKKD